MNIEYKTTLTQQAWTLPPEQCPPGHKVTYGFWIKDTTDQIVKPKTQILQRDYVYRPLTQRDNIRLLLLEPGKREDPLSGSLVEYAPCRMAGGSSLSYANGRILPASRSAHDYEALSYLWGQHVSEKVISIDGANFFIGGNLAEALTYIRSPYWTKTLWVDAICINQADIGEKSTQVPLMLNIYAGARNVDIWLGPSTEDSDAGIAALSIFARGCGPTFRSELSSWDLGILQAGLKDIFNRPWFTRIWVVQEGAVAQKVTMRCGSSQLSCCNCTEGVLRFSRAIKAAAIFAQISDSWRQTGLNEVEVTLFLQLLQTQLENGPEKASYIRNRPSPDMLDVAYEMRHRQAADPRDKIWAILGMVDPVARKEFAPDYYMSFEEMWEKFEELVCSSDGPMLSSNKTIEEARQELNVKLGEVTTTTRSRSQRLQKLLDLGRRILSEG